MAPHDIASTNMKPGPFTKRALLAHILERLDRIEGKLDRILTLETHEMADLTQLTSDVAANSDAVASAVTLLQTIKSELDAAGTDPAALDALSASLEANTEALANAVVANTPAGPPTP